MATRRPLTVIAAAEQLGVSRMTVYRLVRRGELAHVRVSDCIRIRARDLAAYLRAHRSRAWHRGRSGRPARATRGAA